MSKDGNHVPVFETSDWSASKAPALRFSLAQHELECSGPVIWWRHSLIIAATLTLGDGHRVQAFAHVGFDQCRSGGRYPGPQVQMSQRVLVRRSCRRRRLHFSAVAVDQFCHGTAL
eukprot:Skav203857  [mRNA]  locus=scaffold1970:54714:56346:- [translate_table: standard]